jgi:tRNA-dihydrouridine synthase C
MLPLPFTSPALLAPMDRVTDPCFRDLVLDRNPPEALGGAFTEFVRVNDDALSERILRRHLGPRRHAAPVGLQIMGSKLEAVAHTAHRAQSAGAPLVDLNFGCPAKGAVRSCAGSALLDDPPKVEALVRACVDAVDGIPVSAKIRAGGDDDSRLEEIAHAVQDGGASLLTVHCRTRKEKYDDTADWERLRRAVAAVSIPVCGNGGVECHADLERLRTETGCAYVMVGRGAMADPWIFCGREVDRTEAAGFLADYSVHMHQGGAPEDARAGRIKQLLRFWRAGGLVDGRRKALLSERDPARLLAWVEEMAGVAAG